MKKLRLDLDALEVESFATTPSDSNDAKGTVHGYAPPSKFDPNCFSIPQKDGPCSAGDSCYNTCGSTCYNTCNGTCGGSCNGTCDASCNGSCNISCNGSCHQFCSQHHCASFPQRNCPDIP